MGDQKKKGLVAASPYLYFISIYGKLFRNTFA